MSEHKDEQSVKDIPGVDAADVDDPLRHDPDDAMERAGDSRHTRRELGLPPDADAEAAESPPDE